MRFFAFIGLLAMLAIILVGGYFFGGFFDVGADWEDPKPVAAALTRVRTASIARRAQANPPMPLDEATTISTGARHYATHGCPACHGAPGVEWSKFSEGLNPGPPDLKKVANERAPAELFWVVKNGIRMTGMPSFGKAGMPDSEVWQIVAFLKRLPNVSEADYKSWTAAQ
jgi:Cytochrome C oxidase, cbb3-type, subunit III